MMPWAGMLDRAVSARSDLAPDAIPASALRVAAALALVAIVFATDVRTGSELSVSFFYLLPVALVAWTVGTWPGLAFAALCAAGWFLAFALDDSVVRHPPVMIWNTGIEAAVFATVALALGWARAAREHERELFVGIEAANRALDRELRSVGELQRSLLPAEAPRLAGYEIATHYATSTRAGGDYFDFFALGEGRCGVVVADASGHGSPAALLMGMTRILFRVSARDRAGAGETLARVQAGLGGNTPPGLFVTAAHVVLEAPSGRIEVALAGHPYPIVARASGALEELPTPDGLPLGLDRAPAYPALETRLDPGDVLVVYTDGLTEATRPDGEMYGVERLRRRLEATRREPAAAICDALAADAARFSGRARPEDDVTIVVVRRAPGEAGSDA